MKPKFDGYAAQYDAWFMENENVFQSEFRLFEKAIGDISGKRVLSVGCGSGLFESMIDCKNIEGVEPSRDMGAIAQKRGINVIAFGAIEEGNRSRERKNTARTERLLLCQMRGRTALHLQGARQIPQGGHFAARGRRRRILRGAAVERRRIQELQ